MNDSTLCNPNFYAASRTFKQSVMELDEENIYLIVVLSSFMIFITFEGIIKYLT